MSRSWQKLDICNITDMLGKVWQQAFKQDGEINRRLDMALSLCFLHQLKC